MTHQTIRKIIKVGPSAAVTLPPSALKELDLTFGDEVKITIEQVQESPKHDKLMQEYKAFVAEYGETLNNLSDR